MGKVVIGDSNAAEFAPFTAVNGVTARGTVTSRSVIDGPDRALTLRQHELAPGASLDIDAPPENQLFLVSKGSAASVDGEMPPESVLAVTPGAKASITAGADGATLLHFSGLDPNDKRATGKPHVHQVGPKGMFRGHSRKNGKLSTLWLDSTCPDCSIWMHCNRMPPTYKVGIHQHSEDEIIAVTSGALQLGRRALGPGTAIAVDGNTRYSFAAGEDEDLHFVNFRVSEPWFVGFDEKMTPQPPGKESEIWRTHFIPAV